MRSVVVLPAPFGPRKPKTSPRSAAKDTSRHAGRPPKDLESPCASIAAKRRRSYPSALPGVLPGSGGCRCASSSPPDSAEPGVLPAGSVTMAGLRALPVDGIEPSAFGGVPTPERVSPVPMPRSFLITRMSSGSVMAERYVFGYKGAMRAQADVIVVGAGHNGLVAALMLARRGLDVLVLEEKDVVGGAARTERPFARVPGRATSTGAYLLGLMPPELLRTLGIELPLLRRDPHYCLPTTGKRYLLFGSNANAMREQFLSFFSEQDWRANEALQREISAIRDDVAPTWLEEPLSLEDTAAKYVRPALRQIFVDLCRKPVGQYLDRFGFRSDLLKAMYAVTDGFSGLSGDWDTPGTGMNFLVHNMCRLPGSDGTWMIVRGGMGTVTQTLAGAARQAGATIETGRGARAIATGPLRVSLRGGVADVKAGRSPAFPPTEWYVHAPVDPSLRDAHGHHSSALFVQWVPYALSGTSWDAEESRYVRHLLHICDRFAPGTSALVADAFPLTPPKIEQHFGISRGHIHHVDNSFGFADRLPYATPVEGVYSCSAGCHPAGSVIGAAGHNAAARVLRDLAA